MFKHEYVEMSKGIGIDYTEMVVPKHEVKVNIMCGWKITRLSKVTPDKVYDKWRHAIIAIESN